MRTWRLVLAGLLSVTATLGQSSIAQNAAQLPKHVSSKFLVEVRDLDTISVSPNGRFWAAYSAKADLKSNDYVTEWLVGTADSGSSPINVGHGGDVILSDATGNPGGESLLNGARYPVTAQWSPDSHWIAYQLSQAGEIQLWRSHVGSQRQERLTSNRADVQAIRWATDGSKIYFEVGGLRAEHDCYVRDEDKTGARFDNRFVPLYSTAPVFKDDASARDFSTSVVAKTLWVYDLQNRIERLASFVEQAEYAALRETASGAPSEAVRIVEGSRTGRVAWTANVDPAIYRGPSAPVRLYAHFGRGATRKCEPQDCAGSIAYAWWSLDGHEIYFIRREGLAREMSHLYGWDPVDGALRRILQTEDQLDSCQHRAVEQLICFHESWVQPRRVVSINTATGAMSLLHDPNPEFSHFEFGRIEKLVVADSSGEVALGHLVYPTDFVPGERYPLVIVQYRSRGFLRGGVGDEYPIHVLSSNHMAVLSFDRPERISDFQRIPDMTAVARAYWGEDFWGPRSALRTMSQIIDKLEAKGVIDSKRVGITGLSNGAETAWFGLIHSSLFAAAALSDGGWSPSTYFLANAAIRQSYYHEINGLTNPWMGSIDRWRMISPEMNVEKINVPILVQVADHELIQSVPTIASLSDAGKPIEAYVFPNEYHVKWQPWHRMAIYERNVDWMNFWLRNIEDPNPEKVEQYTRWRAMKQRQARDVKPRPH